MIDLILKRILLALPVMFLVAVLVFLLLHLTPGDPAALIAGEFASPDQVRQTREVLGLDRPIWVQFGIFIGNLLRGDLGVSIFSKLPVTHLIAQRLEPTLSLAVLTAAFSVAIAVPAGSLAAYFARTNIDRLALAISILGFSVPVFVVGYALVWIFAVRLGWFPVQGYTPLSSGMLPWLQSLVLPIVTLSTSFMALVIRITRNSLLETLSQDFVRTARAKGLADGFIVWRHALPNAAIPIATVVGVGFALLLGGVVVTETVFAIPGIGRLLVDAIAARDYPIIQGVTLLLAAIYIVVNLCVDLSYTLFDPRVRP